MPEPTRRGPSWVAVASLLLNVVLAGALWQTTHAQNRRLGKLEAVTKADHPRPTPTPSPGTGAGRDDRVAFLLAAAGNADESKRVLANRSLPECVEMGRTLLARPPASDRNAALGAIIEHLANNDPQRALTLLGEVKEAALRATLATTFSNVWIEQSADAAARWLVASGDNFLTPDVLETQLTKAITRWATYDPMSSTVFLVSSTTPGKRLLAALSESSTEWGRKDPAAALTWAQNLPSANRLRFGIIQSVLAGWAEHQPAEAAAYLQQRLYDGGEGNDLYFATVGLIADRWAGTNVAAAAQWATTLQGVRARRDALRRVTSAWAASNLPAAAQWAGTLAADPARSAAWLALVAAWPTDNLDVEGGWVSNLPVSRDRDETLAAYIGKFAPLDPEKALTWARTISDPDVQERTIAAILTAWERTDPSAARNWAAANRANSAAQQ